MAWDSNRPVPWERLMREWVVYALIMGALVLLLFRGGNTIGALAGVLVSGPLYLAFGFVLAKFGYQRKTMSELREQRTARASRGPSAESAPTTRARPAPTKRTGGGANRPAKRKRR